MKVILVGDFPKDDKTYGGVEGVLVNLTNELIHRLDIELVIVSMSITSDLKRFEDDCTTYTLNFRSSLLKARKAFNKIFSEEKPDIIHLQGVVPGALLYKKEYRKIFIVTQHAVIAEERLWQVTQKRKLLFKVKELVENYYLRKIKNVLFISEYNKNIYFEKFGQKRAINYELIANPVNEVFFQTPIPLVDQNSSELYFVGEIKKRKGLHVLIRALHILKEQGYNHKLHVIGGFKESQYEKEIMNLIESFDLSANIVFCGWKNQLEVIEYAKRIPVFVLPSFQETLPLSIAEAMCQGKIVVATNICGIPEMIENGVSGHLFPLGDSEALANVLKRIFTDIDSQTGISEEACLRGAQYNSKNIVAKTIAFYKTL